MDSGAYINYILSFLMRKITVPSDFHSQVTEIKNMLGDDMSGLTDSLTDFSVNSATVDYKVVTKNDNLNKILQKWLDSVNMDYNGQIPIGVKNVAKEYFKERWKGGSFPVLKIKWDRFEGLQLPVSMFFVDGGSIYAKDKKKDEDLSLLSYDYYLGNTEKKQYKLAGDNVIFARPYGRWFDKYPTPFLIKRGVFHNWKIIQSIKNKEIEILEQVIPYMLLVKKGTEALATTHTKMYTDPELKEVKVKFQKLMDDIKANSTSDHRTKAPVRTTGFDEQIDHIIPDIKNLFAPALFETAERNILTGLGFIDVVEGTSSSRRESILNPKAFIEEIKTGVDDFKQILYQLVLKIIEKNKNNKKWMNSEFYVTASPVRGFMTDKFKQLVRLLWKGGKISNQTAVEVIAEVDFRTEVMRTQKEQDEGIEEIMYPRITENREGQGIDIPGKDGETDVRGNPIPEYKKGTEKKDYDLSSVKCECLKCGKTITTDKHCNEIKCPSCGGKMRRPNRPGTGRPDKSPNAKGELETNKKDLEIAPYENIQALPKGVKDNMTPALSRTWLKVFNNAYKTYGNDKQASSVAWALIKKIAKKNKDGRWVKISARIKITKSMIEEVMEEFEEDVMDEAGNKMMKEVLEEKNLNIAKMKEALLKKLLNPPKDTQ